MNEYVTRLVALWVVIVIVTAWYLSLPWLLLLLLAGFVTRLGWGPRYSLAARSALVIADRLWEPRMILGAPKRFAQGLGAFCTLSALVAFWLGAPLLGWAIAAMLAFFAFLEASLAFCMGCLIYGWLQRRGWLGDAEECVDCVLPRRDG